METVQFFRKEGVYQITLIGDLEFKSSSCLDALLSWMKGDSRIKQLVIDLSRVQRIDSTNLGMLAQLGLYAQEHHKLPPVLNPGKGAEVKDTLNKLQLNQLFYWADLEQSVQANHASPRLVTLLPRLNETESQICERAIRAHKALVSLGANNTVEFSGVLAGLQVERAMLASEGPEQHDDTDAAEHDLAELELETMELNRPHIKRTPRAQGRVH